MRSAKRWAIGATAGVLLAVGAACRGEDAAGAGGESPAAEQTRIEARARKMAEMTAELNLTSNQQARIGEILVQQDAEMARHQDATLNRQKSLAAALKTKDRAAQEELRKEMADASNRQMEIYRRHSQAILDVLTPEQQAGWRVFGVYQSIVSLRLRGCTLSAEQQAAVRKLCAAAVAAASSTAMAREEYMMLIDTIEKTVLTAAQRDEVLLHPLYSRVLRDLQGCELTAEQDARVRALCMEAARAAKAEATNAVGVAQIEATLRKARGISETVQKTVLTDAQRLDMETGKVFASLIHGFQKANLSGEQQARIRALCRDAAAGLGASADYTARAMARRSVVERARAEVLTEAQRALVPAPQPMAAVMPVDAPTNRPAPAQAP